MTSLNILKTVDVWLLKLRREEKINESGFNWTIIYESLYFIGTGYSSLNLFNSISIILSKSDNEIIDLLGKFLIKDELDGGTKICFESIIIVSGILI